MIISCSLCVITIFFIVIIVFPSQFIFCVLKLYVYILIPLGLVEI